MSDLTSNARPVAGGTIVLCSLPSFASGSLTRWSKELARDNQVFCGTQGAASWKPPPRSRRSRVINGAASATNGTYWIQRRPPSFSSLTERMEDDLTRGLDRLLRILIIRWRQFESIGWRDRGLCDLPRRFRPEFHKCS